MKYTLFIIIIKILFSLSKTFLELNNDSFNELVEKNKHNKNKKLLVIFYTKNCYNCQEAIRIITNDIFNEYKDDYKIEFGKVDCDLRENIWLNIRFNITRIPYIIIIKGNYFYELKSNYDKFELNYFINEQKDRRELLEIPEDISLIQKRIIIMRYTYIYINQYFESKYNITIHKNIIIFIFILFLILLLWLLFYLFSFCCWNLCFYKICKRKKVKQIIQMVKEDSLSKMSNNISGSDIISKEEENKVDKESDSSYISDSYFNEVIDRKTIVKKYYYKTKIE